MRELRKLVNLEFLWRIFCEQAKPTSIRHLDRLLEPKSVVVSRSQSKSSDHVGGVRLNLRDENELRLFNARRELPHSELACMAQIVYAREMAFIAVRTLPDGTAQTLGVVRAIIDPDNVDAEFAILVRSDLKGQGLARLWLRKMIDFLARRGTQRMVGYVLRENEAMRELAQSQGFVVDAVASDADALFLALTLQAR